MKGLNRVEFIGYLGKAPVITNFEKGGKKAEFTIATTDGYRDAEGNWQNITDWHNCYVSGKLAETVEQYFEKGMRVFVEGKLKHRSYEDNSGVKRYVTEVRVLDFMFLTTKQALEEKGSIEDSGREENDEDDLPF